MRSTALMLCALLIGTQQVHPQEFAFPINCGVVDVTGAPYHAKGDGMTDDTAAIQKALDDHPNEGAIIYLPHGTYKISDTLRWPKGNRGGMEEKNTILQGQSRKGTTIRLADKCEGFLDPSKPKAMIWTGRAPAQRFRNAVRSLTFETGRDNPGATGLQFMANNQGTVVDVTIRSGDGTGPVGLDLGYTDENGPCLIKDVQIEGFDVGVKAASAVNSLTFERLVLKNQRKYGVWNAGQVVNMRGLKSTNSVPAIYNQKGPSYLTLIDADLRGVDTASKSPAIINEAPIFVRNATSKGYSSILSSVGGEGASVGGHTIDEYSYFTPMSLFPAKKQSLQLTVEETPELTPDDPSTWANVRKFGAGGNDYHHRERNDDTAGVQKAIDSGATTVVFPRGFYVLNDTIRVRGKVKRIMFMESQLVAGKGFRDTNKPVFRFEDGDAPVVEFDRFSQTYGSMEKVWLEHATAKRTLVIRNSIMGRYESVGGGKVFLEDVCGGPFIFRKQTVWARQLNQETEGLHVQNDGGTLWILGYKTERGGTLLETINGGRTEVLGCFAYCTTGVSKSPMFVVTDSDFSATMGEAHFGGRFDVLVRESRNGEVRELHRKDAKSRFGIGALLPLFVSDRAPK